MKIQKPLYKVNSIVEYKTRSRSNVTGQASTANAYGKIKAINAVLLLAPETSQTIYYNIENSYPVENGVKEDDIVRVIGE